MCWWLPLAPAERPSHWRSCNPRTPFFLAHTLTPVSPQLLSTPPPPIFRTLFLCRFLAYMAYGTLSICIFATASAARPVIRFPAFPFHLTRLLLRHQSAPYSSPCNSVPFAALPSGKVLQSKSYCPPPPPPSPICPLYCSTTRSSFSHVSSRVAPTQPHPSIPRDIECTRNQYQWRDVLSCPSLRVLPSQPVRVRSRMVSVPWWL